MYEPDATPAEYAPGVKRNSPTSGVAVAAGATGTGAFFFLAFFFAFFFLTAFFGFFFSCVAAAPAAVDDAGETSAEASMALETSPPTSRPTTRYFRDDRFIVRSRDRKVWGGRSAGAEPALEVPDAAVAVERPAGDPARPLQDEVLGPGVVGPDRRRAGAVG